MIPFIAYFVVPYALYPVVMLVPFYLYWKDYRNYKTVAITMAAVLLISISIFILFQTRVERASVEPADIFTWGVAFVYSLDEPVNAFPSLHVSLPTTAALFVYRKNRRIGLYAAVLTFLIILSTMFIKQHSMIDVLGGLALAFAAFRYREFFWKLKI